ncbi:DNA repair protein [Sesamum alatum]|uniref:DNA repair protein n=1 Tax=Sesamum alatum TaxID=300844 RepID=A0AAE1Y0D2_9LAMI|nr:DNA repair protein [Sesamum alatum]
MILETTSFDAKRGAGNQLQTLTFQELTIAGVSSSSVIGAARPQSYVVAPGTLPSSVVCHWGYPPYSDRLFYPHLLSHALVPVEFSASGRGFGSFIKKKKLLDDCNNPKSGLIMNMNCRLTIMGNTNRKLIPHGFYSKEDLSRNHAELRRNIEKNLGYRNLKAQVDQLTSEIESLEERVLKIGGVSKNEALLLKLSQDSLLTKVRHLLKCPLW